jgi:hypothetical protein
MTTTEIVDANQRPSAVFAASADPAKTWPGAPTNFGEIVVPHAFTVAGQVGLAGRAYLNADEAIRHSRANSERMRVDCQIMECLEARQRATALLNWHVEADDEKDSTAKSLAEALTPIVKRTPRFLELRRCLLEAIWYGRYATAMQFGTREIRGTRAISVTRWEPRHGDKLVFRYDDGSGEYTPDQVGIRLGVLGQIDNRPIGLNRQQVSYTDQGMVYWLAEWERKTLIVHKHTVEDGIFEDSVTSGRIHGVGVRSRVYWTWYAMVECLQRALEYLDRSAFGVELWRYPANNPKAKSETERAAKNNVGGGRSIVMVPVFPGDQQDMYGVEHIEPGLQGVDRLLQVIKEYFGHKIKRYILGQTLTSEADATGLGSGVADAHLATFADIVQYDARNLEETLTEDFIRHLQSWNFPGSEKHYLRFVIDTESPNVKEKMEAYKSAWDMGLTIPAENVADVIGISLDPESARNLFNPKIVGGIMGMMGNGANGTQPGATVPMNPSTPEQLQEMIMAALMKSNGNGGFLSLN